jgi:hypothetical protein
MVLRVAARSLQIVMVLGCYGAGASDQPTEMKMANESNQKVTKLTLHDPVDPPTLKRIGEITQRRWALGELNLDLDQEKVKILVESRKLDEERKTIFAKVLSDRGLAPNIGVEVDPESGKIELVRVSGRAEPPAPKPPEVAAVTATPGSTP